MNQNEIIRGRIKELRKSVNKTQEKFAESIDVSSQLISNLERGRTSLSSDIALKIAKEYAVSLDWLFYQCDERISPTCKLHMQEAFDCMSESNEE